ncbi:hypothetical protein RchiOBHm_Chr1g0342351 [Rosa chinensis]|uniref:Uncharacterized protein n=1 Tax=Rosa chinensis TaxID=74649 RepID=A0A2P6SDZ9_ROSCH|nr:hypothetical protein RchiOBHm_Chr1g0342351 [Rosa chinensis]
MTSKEVKFSEAISSMSRQWRRFSFSIRSWIYGSMISRLVFPQAFTASIGENGER